MVRVLPGNHQKYPAVLPEYYEKKSPVNPYVFMKNFLEGLEENDIVVTENGSACVVSFQAKRSKKRSETFTIRMCQHGLWTAGKD